ncbi:MAG: non-ribosomal peptide synthetase, partial [Acidobacteriaceae bacterium]
EATAERFLPDHASSMKGRRKYRTGDRVRQRADGMIEFVGRLDHQVKIAGHRVELNLVESLITSSPLVAEAAVLAVAPASGEKQLVAFVALAGLMENAEGRLRGWLSERISRASMPQRWIFMERLPVKANGKLDRAAVRASCEAVQSLGSDGTAEATGSETLSLHGIEQYLRRLWGELLNTAIAIDDNFFDMGGTSIKLMEMHARLKTRFPANLSVVDLFALPTPRALAERLHAGAASLSRLSSGAEDRGQRQRAAMMARRITVSSRRSASRDGATSTADKAESR